MSKNQKPGSGLFYKKHVAPRLNNAKSGVSTVLASLVCVLIGMAIGFLFLMILGWITLSQRGVKVGLGDLIAITRYYGFDRILAGGAYEPKNNMGMGMRLEIVETAPLIMTGLSVAFAFKTGLFNIGASGQYTVGAYFALYTALVLKQPWWVCLIAAAVGGAIWGSIPGIFKAFLNVNEVITAIMFNWIALYGVNTLIYQRGNGPMYEVYTTKTKVLDVYNPDSVLPTFNIKKADGTDYFGKMEGLFSYEPTIGILIAIAVAVLIWFVLNKTVFGYELKACGYNKHAAKYAGINDKRNIILSMTIAGALSGLGAGLFYLSNTKQWTPLVSTALPAEGFNGISVALLASSNPVGCIFSALFISHITAGGGAMDTSLFPIEVSNIISGVIIYLCAFSLLFKGSILKLMEGRTWTAFFKKMTGLFKKIARLFKKKKKTVLTDEKEGEK